MRPVKCYVIEALTNSNEPFYFNGEIQSDDIVPEYTPFLGCAKIYKNPQDAMFERFALGLHGTNVRTITLYRQ